MTDLNLTVAGLVDTWHDGPDSPSLVTCAPPGYVYMERARPRRDDQACSMLCNHGGVCLLYHDRLHARLIRTAEYKTFQHIAVYLHGSALRTLFIVVYRPGSVAAPSAFFDEFAHLLDHANNYTSVVIMGDVNIHLDNATDAATVSFALILTSYNLIQVVQSPTHTAEHLLDVVIVRVGTTATRVNVPPPPAGLSDHSMIDVTLDLRYLNQFESTSCAVIQL